MAAPGRRPLSDGLRIRRADASDAPLLARHRVEMFVDMGSLAAGSEIAAAIRAASERMFAASIPAGEWTAWIAEDAAGALGGGAAILRPALPNPLCPAGGTMAYLLNFYTEPQARRRGVATALLRTCLLWCRERRVVRIGLHASAAGRRVYERLGFVPRDGEMEWDADAARRCGEPW